MLAMSAGAAMAQDAERPDIPVIWGDDVEMWNISRYHRGMQCCETPNIDRIADEGMLFMDRSGCFPSAERGWVHREDEF